MNNEKTFLSFCPSIFLLSHIPNIIPREVRAINRAKMLQSIFIPENKSPPKPTKELVAIIASEVPIDCFMLKPKSITNVGMIRNPPPAPTIPVKKPMAELPKTSFKNLNFLTDLVVLKIRGLSIKKDATNISDANNSIMKISFGIFKNFSGRFGIINARVISTEIIAGTIKIRAERISTKFFLK